jgi:uncharacterized membrane-anchored protein
MEDTFTRGFVAGIIGGIPTNAYSLFAGAIGITDLRTVDLIGALLYAYSPPFGYGEIALALVGHILISGILGIGFAYFIPIVTSRNIFLKGWLFSITIWFLVYAGTTLFRVPGTIPTSLNTTITDLISATIFGLILAFALRKLTPSYS